MALQFTQEEIEREMSERLPHGTRREVARLSGFGESYIKRQFNPDDETVSCAFRILQVACALDEIDPDVGDRFWNSLVHFRTASKTQKSSYSADAESVSFQTGKLGKEIMDVVTARLTDCSLKEQFDELLEAKAQLEHVENAILEEIKEAHQARRRTNGDLRVHST